MLHVLLDVFDFILLFSVSLHLIGFVFSLSSNISRVISSVRVEFSRVGKIHDVGTDLKTTTHEYLVITSINKT